MFSVAWLIQINISYKETQMKVMRELSIRTLAWGCAMRKTAELGEGSYRGLGRMVNTGTTQVSNIKSSKSVSYMIASRGCFLRYNYVFTE